MSCAEEEAEKKYWHLDACKSPWALSCEQKAMELFDAFMGSTAESQIRNAPLLQPSVHLTKACYASFVKFVKAHPGWTCRRRPCTDLEKRHFNVATTGRGFFVDVSYNATKNPAAKQLRISNRPRPNDHDKENTDAEQPVKKLRMD